MFCTNVRGSICSEATLVNLSHSSICNLIVCVHSAPTFCDDTYIHTHTHIHTHIHTQKDEDTQTQTQHTQETHTHTHTS